VDGRNAREPVRRVIDVSIAAVALVLLSPLVIAVALLVALIDGRPILYCQERIGRYGRPFKILKFRTMRDERDHGQPGHGAPPAGAAQADVAEFVRAVKDAGMAEVTSLGRLLRATSLDELPQLWNVLRGDMSVVGPRPLRDFEVRSLESWQLTRLRVRPGITGLWQVRGRSDLDWSERMRLDYLYVRHRSVVEDLAILTDTIPAVFTRRGAM
jgi:lipopolysaccharide/colanic/teichoic acid biosynthesis glycosyltransferase